MKASSHQLTAYFWIFMPKDKGTQCDQHDNPLTVPEFLTGITVRNQ